MPYLITTATYPSDRAPDVAKMYLEAIVKFPPDDNLATQVVPAAVKATSQGIKVLGVAEIKEGKLEEAYKRIVNLEAMFINIEGYEYTIDTYLKVEEALARYEFTRIINQIIIFSRKRQSLFLRGGVKWLSSVFRIIQYKVPRKLPNALWSYLVYLILLRERAITFIQQPEKDTTTFLF